jgi:hypothetical protein
MAEIRKFGWLRTPSAWQQAQAWRSRRAALTADSLNAGDTFNALFSKANKDRIEGMAKLAAEAAVKRIKDATKVKVDQTVAGIDKLKVDMKI